MTSAIVLWVIGLPMTLGAFWFTPVRIRSHARNQEHFLNLLGTRTLVGMVGLILTFMGTVAMVFS